LSGGGGEGVEFFGSAHNRQAVKFGRHHAGDEAGEGVELVEPCAPEAGDLGLGNRHAAEEGEDDHDKGVDQAGNEARWRDCRDHLSQRDGEELGDQDHEELVACAGR